MARFIVVDKLIRSSSGHFLEYSTRLGQGFEAQGYQTVFLANRRFSGSRPAGLRPVIDFDYDRVMLGEDRKARRDKEKAHRQLVAKARRKERARLSTLGIASAVYHDMLRGSGGKQDRGAVFAALMVFAGTLALRLLMLMALLLVWPFKKLWQGVRGLGRALSSGRAGDWVRSRISWAREFAVPSGQLRAAAVGVRDALVDPFDVRNQQISIARALERLKLQPDDIVLWTTVKEVDLEVALGVAKASPASRKAVWHFIFREPIFLNEGPNYLMGQQHRNLRTKVLELAAQEGIRIGWWCDTEELAEQYSVLGAGLFGVLPVIMPEALAEFAHERTEAKATITIGYFGDARPEKGYGMLPELLSKLAHRKSGWNQRILGGIRAAREVDIAKAEVDRVSPNMRETILRQRRLRLAQREARELEMTPDLLDGAPAFGMLAQSNFNVPDGVSLTRQARYRLMAQDDIGAEIFTTPPPSAGYVANFGKSDIVAVNYTHELYRAGSSGVFAEAIMAGRPVLVSDETWGGRRLRTAPGYVEHLSALFDSAKTQDLGSGFDELMSSATVWRLRPAPATHIGLRLHFTERSVTDQVKITVHVRRRDGTVVSRTRNFCNRLETAPAIIALPHDAMAVSLQMQRLNPRLMIEDLEIEAAFLQVDPASDPISAIGISVSHGDEALQAIVEMGRHFKHYRRTAAKWSDAWREEHMTTHAVERIIAASQAVGGSA